VVLVDRGGWALSAVNDRHLTLYNQQRMHSSLDYATPAKHERAAQQELQPAA
jgi:hypothetical protein